jgi:biotin carboxyl carrier protein
VSTYVALLDGGRREEKVEVRRLGPGAYEVRLRGKLHLVDAFRHDYGTLSLLVDGKSHSVMLDWRDAKVNVRLRHAIVPLELLDERKLRMRRATGKFTAAGAQPIVAPMPGRVAKVLVRAGDEVREGQGLVVFEAMKMENELKSPKDGKVVEVLAREGETVEAGTKLCTVE